MSEIKKTDSEDTRKVKEESRAAREEKRAEERVAAAQRREEEKKAKLAAQEEKARIRAEKQAEEHERARLEAERREEERQRKIEERRNRKKYDGKGYGGWLAAVVSLSVAVLALGAIVTVGYFDLKDAKGDLVGGMHESVYELSEQVEQLDTDLAKVRVSQGNYETQKLLSDMLVRCRLAERAVEDFPVDGHGAQRLTAFFNEAGDCAQKMLLKLAAGGQLSEEDARQLEEYYRDMQTVREAMPALLECADTEKNLLGEGDFDKRFEDLTARLHSKGSLISKEKAEKSGEEIGEEAALERAKNFFSDYKVQDMRCTGKTEGAFSAYTIEFTDGAGVHYGAQITAQGELMMLESYKPCEAENFDVRQCRQIATRFLEKCGYGGLCPVWANRSGSECTITFVGEQGDVLIYPERILVKVCSERGIVTGMEAHLYLKNRGEREIGEGKISMERIERAAAERMQVRGVRRAVIPVDGQETLTYEIRGNYGGRMYFAYINADTGETVDIRVVTRTDRGWSLL